MGPQPCPHLDDRVYCHLKYKAKNFVYKCIKKKVIYKFHNLTEFHILLGRLPTVERTWGNMKPRLFMGIENNIWSNFISSIDNSNSFKPQKFWVVFDHLASSLPAQGYF
jgi:hypothetical protein